MFGPQLVALFGEVTELLEVELCWRRHLTGDEHLESTPLPILPFCFLCVVENMTSQLPVPATMISLSVAEASLPRWTLSL